MKQNRKSEKRYDSITDIRDDLVNLPGQTHPAQKHFWKKRYFAAVAAVLAVIITAGITLLPFGESASVTTHTIAEADYPQSAPYPEESSFTKDDGSIDSDSYNTACDVWLEDVMARRRLTDGYADSMNHFLLKSIRQFLSTSQHENLAYSPLNLYIALGMLTELTDKNSQRQILELLDCKDTKTLRSRISDLWNANYRDDGATARILANSVWLDETIDFVPSTLKSLAKNYYASAYRGKMGSDEFNGMLQEWLNKQTGELLKEQALQLEILKEETILALAATVYFRGKWQSEFSPANTNPQDFHTDSGAVTCDFMHKKEINETYYWGKNFSAVSQTMGESGSMWFLMPEEGVTPADLLNDSQAMDFLISRSRWTWEFQKDARINLAVPKFDISSQLDLGEGLQALGITDVFDPEKSDFSPMTSDMDGIFLSDARHAVRVTVDEQGAAAAAYTVMAVSGGGMEQPDEVIDFVLDRPFLFVITDAAELPLFAGIVHQP